MESRPGTPGQLASPPRAPRPAAAPAPRWSWALEAGVGLCLAWAITKRWGGQLPGLDLAALVVALLGARFGYALGVGAGALAGVVDLLAAGVNPAHLLDPAGGRAALLAATVKLLIGVAAGLIGDAHRAAAARARGEAAESRERLGALSRRYRVLAEAKEALDRRVVGQLHTVSSLYEGAKELEVLVPERVCPAGLRLTARFLEADAVAYYELAGDRLALVDAVGDRPDRPQALPLDEGLAAEALRLRAAAAVRGKDDHRQGRALMAAPILAPDGRPRGVLVVEKLPFVRLTPDAIALLELIADWTARALATSEAFVAQQGGGYVNAVTGIHQAGYMIEQLNREWRIAQRYELPLSVLVLRRAGLAELPPREREAESRRIAAAIRQGVRQIDQVGHYRTEDSFLVILPVTPLAQAQLLAQRFGEAALGLSVEAASFEGRAANPETVLQKLQALLFPPGSVGTTGLLGASGPRHPGEVAEHVG